MKERERESSQVENGQKTRAQPPTAKVKGAAAAGNKRRVCCWSEVKSQVFRRPSIYLIVEEFIERERDASVEASDTFGPPVLGSVVRSL